MCVIHGFDWDWDLKAEKLSQRKDRLRMKSKTALVEEDDINDIYHIDEGTSARQSKRRKTKTGTVNNRGDFIFSYRRHFRSSYITRTPPWNTSPFFSFLSYLNLIFDYIETNWRKGGTLIRSHRLPVVSPHHGTVTSLALDSEWVVVGFADAKIQIFSARTGVLSRTLVGHESGVWGLCLVSSGGDKLVDTNKPKAGKKRKPRNSRDGKKVEKSFDSTSSSKKQKTHRKPSTKDVAVKPSSSQPSLRTLRAGIAGIDLHSNNRDGSDGMHVMPSESLDSFLSRAMKIALGLEVSTDSEHGDSGDDSHREDEAGNHTRKGCTTTSEEEDPLGTATGADQGEFSDKPSNMCYVSQGWGQPNSLIVSGGCDKVVRVWDVPSGQISFSSFLLDFFSSFFLYKNCPSDSCCTDIASTYYMGTPLPSVLFESCITARLQ